MARDYFALREGFEGRNGFTGRQIIAARARGQSV
jgi:hypothetical protein